MRLFAALVPPEDVLDHVEAALDGVRSGSAAALRWVPRENLHLTLAFYGDVPEGALPDVVASISLLAERTPTPMLALSGAGSFSGRALWLGVSGDVTTLQRLMVEAAEPLDVDAPDPKRPHLTVARSGRRSRGLDLSAAVRALSVYRGPAWRPAEIVLCSSHLGEGRAGAPLYVVEERIAWE